MARIELDHLGHAYTPGVPALKPLNQAFADGGAYALLGPSGCGKTTLLNIISGLIQPSQGRVLFDGADVTALPTRDRNIAQVFQFPVIYDTMTVAQNLAFPLKNRGVAAAQIAPRVAKVLAMLDLTDWADRKARGLTADQKQKISLGRGLVRTDVNAILFDEPLTVIDPQLKWRLRSQLKEIHRESGHTMVYVTHDQTEALTFADQVVVMHDGEIVQIGTPAELFDHPRHTFVGYFIGSPGMNLIAAQAAGDTANIGSAQIALPAGVTATGAVELGVRPEHVSLGREGLPFTIERVEDIGRARIVRGRIEGQSVAAIVNESSEIPSDAKASFRPDRLGVFVDSRRLEPAA